MSLNNGEKIKVPNDHACHLPIHRGKVREKTTKDAQGSGENNYRQEQ